MVFNKGHFVNLSFFWFPYRKIPIFTFSLNLWNSRFYLGEIQIHQDIFDFTKSFSISPRFQKFHQDIFNFTKSISISPRVRRTWWNFFHQVLHQEGCTRTNRLANSQFAFRHSILCDAIILNQIKNFRWRICTSQLCAFQTNWDIFKKGFKWSRLWYIATISLDFR